MQLGALLDQVQIAASPVEGRPVVTARNPATGYVQSFLPRIHPPTHSQYHYGPEAGPRCVQCDNGQYRLQDLPCPSGIIQVGNVGFPVRDIHWICTSCGHDTIVRSYTLVGTVTTGGNAVFPPGPWGRGQISGRPIPGINLNPDPDGRRRQLHCPLTSETSHRIIQIRESQATSASRDVILRCLGFPPLPNNGQNRQRNQGCERCGVLYPNAPFPFTTCPYCGDTPSYHCEYCCPRNPYIDTASVSTDSDIRPRPTNPRTLTHFPMSDADYQAQQVSGDDPWLTLTFGAPSGNVPSGTEADQAPTTGCTQDVADEPSQQPRETPAKIPRTSPEGSSPRRCACPCAVKHTARNYGDPQFCNGWALHGSDRCSMCQESDFSYPSIGVFGIPSHKLVLLCKCMCPNCPRRDYFLEHNNTDAPSRSSQSKAAPDTEE